MKQKFLTLLLGIIASVGTMYAAGGKCGKNLTWNLTDGVLTISGTGDMYDYTWDVKGDTLWVSSPWYSQHSNIISVVIANTVTSIGDFAFQNCTRLTSITIPNSVTKIGEWPFTDCINLTSIIVESDNPNYSSEDGVLFNKDKTTLIICPESKLGNTYVIPNSVTRIAEAAFSYCISLNSITIPNSVTSIEAEAFEGCTGLTSVIIPNSVTSIGSYAFYGCSSLTTITMNPITPPTMMKWNGSCSGSDCYEQFSYCDNLIAIYVPCGTIDAYKSANVWKNFKSKIEYAPLPYSINIYAVNGSVSAPQNLCDAIEITALPDSGYHFTQWSDGISDNPRTIILTQDTTFTAEFASDRSGTCGENNALTWSYDDQSRTLTITGNGALTDNYTFGTEAPTQMHTLIIGNGVTSIGSYAFMGCTSLTSVTIGDNVSSIGNSAFSGCTGLTSVHITNLSTWCAISFIGIASNPLYYANDLYMDGELITDLVIPNDVNGIGNYAFYGCSSLTSVTISNSITHIGSYAFYGCSGMTSIEIPNSVTHIGSYAFYGCTSLNSIELPNSVISIGGEVFDGCSNITSITIPKSVASIGGLTFKGCTGLTSVVWNAKNCADFSSTNNLFYSAGASWNGESFDIRSQITSFVFGEEVEHIPAAVCSGLTNLTSIEIPNSVKSIGMYAFSGCSGVTSLIIPKNVTSIGNCALYNCTGLTSITWNAKNGTDFSYGNSPFYYYDYRGLDGDIRPQINSFEFGKEVEHIPAYLCEGMSQLTNITIPNSVTSIGNYAFEGCENLTAIYVHCEESLERFQQMLPDKAELMTIKHYALNIEANHGNVSYSACEEEVPLNAIPDQGYHFVQWSDGITDNPRTIILTQDTTFTAEFALNKYSISVDCDSTQGTIEGETGDIDYMTEVSYIAVPKYGYHFDYWIYNGQPIDNTKLLWDYTETAPPSSSPDYGLYYSSIVNDIDLKGIKLNSSGYCYFTKNAVAGTLDLTFAPRTSGNVSLKIETWDGESASFETPTNLSLITTTQEVSELTTVSIELTENQNNIFIERLASKETVLQKIRFEPMLSGRDTLRFQVVNDASIEAIFAKNSYTVLAQPSNTTQGTVSGSGKFEYLAQEQITATPNYGYHFTQWSDGNIDNPRSFVLTQDTTFTAEFANNTYTITTESDHPEWGTANGGQSGLYLDEIEISAIANYGYHFEQWNDANMQNPRVVSVTEDKTFTATFAKNTYRIYKNASQGSIYGPSQAEYLDEVTLTANPDYGYHYTWWSDGITDNPRTFILTKDTTFTAEFAKNPEITYIYNYAEGWISGNTTLPSEPTGEVTFEAVPNYGYHFVQWSDGITDNPRTIMLTQDTTFSAIFAKNTYSINLQVSDDAMGTVSGAGTYEYNTTCEVAATPNYGYHFEEWFMTDSYMQLADAITVSKAYNIAAGLSADGRTNRQYTIIGYVTRNYGTYTNSYYLSDTPNGPGNFIVFKCASSANIGDRVMVTGYLTNYKGNTPETTSGSSLTILPEYKENPWSFAVMNDMNITAKLAKNIYNITVSSANEEQGYATGSGAFEYLHECVLSATANFSYHFVQWSDGNTDNPRTVVLTQDYAYTAEFAIDKTGTCGKDNALTWSYDDQSMTLTITGNGALTENYTFGLEAPTHMHTLIIGDGVTAIGDSAFYGMANIYQLFIGANVESIGNYTFAECRNFDDITCYATIVPTINATTFENVGNKQYIYLYVPENRERAYHRDEFWGEFDIRIKGTEETTTDTKSVTVEPADNTALFTWPIDDDAASYSLQITKDGEVFCTLTFNANGQLTGIAFAPSRNGAAHAQAATMSISAMSFTVTGLNSASKYAYCLSVTDESQNEIQAYSGEFATTGYEGEVNEGGEPEINTEGLEDVISTEKATKLLRNNQILILRGDHTYTLTGCELK